MNIEFTEEIYARMKALGMQEAEIAFAFNVGARKIDEAKRSFDMFHAETRIDDLKQNSVVARKRLQRFADGRGQRSGYWKSRMGGDKR